MNVFVRALFDDCLINNVFLLIGNKCFYIGGASTRLNYTSAYQLCRRFGNGYDIASIEDIFEQGINFVH